MVLDQFGTSAYHLRTQGCFSFLSVDVARKAEALIVSGADLLVVTAHERR